jgi:hypothetical protein
MQLIKKKFLSKGGNKIFLNYIKKLNSSFRQIYLVYEFERYHS